MSQKYPYFIIFPVYPELIATAIAGAASWRMEQLGGFHIFLDDSLFSVAYSAIFAVASLVALIYRWKSDHRIFLFPRAIAYLIGIALCSVTFQSGWLILFLVVLFLFYSMTPRSMRNKEALEI